MIQTLAFGGVVASSRLLQEGGDVGISVGPVAGVISVIVLVLLNGFFVATEFAMVTVRRNHIEQLAAAGQRAAIAARKTLDQLDKLIAATQLGITMAALGLGWVGEPAVTNLLVPLFDSAPIPDSWRGPWIHTVSVAISFLLITAVDILIGELLPKSIALQRSEGVALAVAIPISIFITVFMPAVRALSGVASFMLRLLGLQPISGEESIHSVEELRYMLIASRKAGVIEPAEEEIATRAFTLGDLSAWRVMVPRTEMVALPSTVTLAEIYSIAAREHHVRFPVYDGDIDHVLGVLHLTDIVGWELLHAGVPFNAGQIARPALIVPESLEGDRLLAQMRKSRTHTAIVVDEFGGVEGMVTLQDLLERIIGDLPETDEGEHPAIEVQPDGTTTVDGLTPVDELGARFGIELEEHEAETVGGYVMETLGRVPEAGEEIRVGAYKLRVAEMDGPRVARLVLDKS